MRRVLFLALAGLVLLVGGLGRAEAQILLVTGDYRVVEMDQAQNRIGVSLPESKPEVRQNWIYVKLDTEVIRHLEKDGWVKDEPVKVEDLWTTIHRGDMMRVHGGRDWSGSITARTIRFSPAPTEGSEPRS